MKKEEIIITDKTIVLGIFEEQTFMYFNNTKSVKGYSDFEDGDGFSLIQVVELACIKADKIIFVLDGVKFPINPNRSITCQELKLICENNDLFNKTVFVKGDNVINFDKNIL